MADDIIVGSVGVDINASANGFIASVKAQVEPGVRQLADNLSKVLEDKIAAGISKGLGQGFAPAETYSKEKGRSSGAGFGGEFGRQAQSRIRAALAALPEAEIGVATSAADQKLRELRLQIAALGDKKIGVDISAADAQAEIAALSAELVALGALSPDIDVRVNTAKAAAELSAFGATADKLAGGGFGDIPGLASKSGSALGGMATKTGPLILGVGVLVTALIPLAGALGGVLVALSAPLGAAAVGGTLYAVLAGKFVGDTNKVAKQIEDLKKRADTLVDPQAAQAARDQAEALEASLTGPQKAFLEAKQALSGAFDDFTSGEAGDAIMAPVIAGMDALADILPALTPLIVSVSDALTDVIESVSDDPEAIDGFVDKLADLAGDAIRDGASILGSLAKSIDAVLTAASPTGESALDGVADAAERLAEHLQSPEGQAELQEFFAWLRENGPDIADAAVDISVALADLLVALEPVGEAALDGLDKLAELISLFSEFSGSPFDPSTFKDAAAVIIDILADLAGVIGKVLSGIGKIPKIGAPFREAGRAMKNAAGDAHDLADAIRGVPSKKNVNINVPTKSQIAAVEALGLKIRGLTGKQIQIAVSYTTKGGSAADPNDPRNPIRDMIPKNARGTNFFEGGLTWINEEGPEIVNLPRGSQIIPHAESMAMMASASDAPRAGAGAGASLSPRALGRALRRELDGATLMTNDGRAMRLALGGAPT